MCDKDLEKLFFVKLKYGYSVFEIQGNIWTGIVMGRRGQNITIFVDCYPH